MDNENTHDDRKLKPDNILRRPAVSIKTGTPRSSLYLKISKGEFPKPIKLSERSVGWLESEIDEWINQRIQQTRHAKEC